MHELSVHLMHAQLVRKYSTKKANKCMCSTLRQYPRANSLSCKVSLSKPPWQANCIYLHLLHLTGFAVVDRYSCSLMLVLCSGLWVSRFCMCVCCSKGSYFKMELYAPCGGDNGEQTLLTAEEIKGQILRIQESAKGQWVHHKSMSKCCRWYGL